MRSLFIILVLMLGLASCNQKSKSPTTEEKPATTSSEFVDVKLATLTTPKDLRCGMPLKEGEIADTANYEGNLYGFCSKECKADFTKDPKSYLNQK